MRSYAHERRKMYNERGSLANDLFSQNLFEIVGAPAGRWNSLLRGTHPCVLSVSSPGVEGAFVMIESMKTWAGDGHQPQSRNDRRILLPLDHPRRLKKPPSRGISAPVMNDAASEQRKRASEATSSGFPMRPTGWEFDSFWNISVSRPA